MSPPRIDPAHFSPDTLAFIEILDRHGVRYVVAPGEAVVPYIGRAELIRNKEASGRPKDLDDLTYLRSQT